MTFSKKTFFILLLFVPFIFSSCKSHSKANLPTIQQQKTGSTNESYTSERLNSLEIKKNPKTPKEKRKILYSANMTVVSPLPDSINPQLERIAEKYDGYVGYLSTRQTTIRVKSEEFENVIEEIEKLGKITRKDIIGNDVTEQYWDAQIRLDNAIATRKRYIELLQMAKNVEEAILVERELARISQDIDLLKGQINKLDNLEEFATITISIREKAKLGLLGYVGVGLYKTVKWFFVRN
ncbi:DUF4349 domain-containing protein [Bernardetia sp.]|uniref:DUF4349 domain-containing protein n=1 Tax=Bernardetia sp. TaxID=1937974 RepID=UPI0025BC5179|nr:DUF4349 domain-containing protein [Bernardetia sp.]